MLDCRAATRVAPRTPCRRAADARPRCERKCVEARARRHEQRVDVCYGALLRVTVDAVVVTLEMF